jgi:hypothetical protein
MRPRSGTWRHVLVACGHFVEFRLSRLPSRPPGLPVSWFDVEHSRRKATVDAFHIGIAAAHQIDYLLTWNCRHIANATMRGTIDAICRSEGLDPPVICTPEELPIGSSR